VVNQISIRLCAVLNGCEDFVHRLPATWTVINCIVFTGLTIGLLSKIYGWRPVAFSAGLVILADLVLYLRLDAAQWQQGDAELTMFFSLFSLIFLLPAEGGLISNYPHLKWYLRLITPALSVCFSSLLWLSTHTQA